MNEITNPNFIQVAECVLDESHPNKFLKWEWKASKLFLKNPTGRVYVIYVDGEIVKFGSSQAKGGTRATLNAYTGSSIGGQPSDRTTGVAMLKYMALAAGKKISVSVALIEPVMGPAEGMFGSHTVLISDPKRSEEICLENYKFIHGTLPIWNTKERNETSPQIKELTNRVRNKKTKEFTKQEMLAFMHTPENKIIFEYSHKKNKKNV